MALVIGGIHQTTTWLDRLYSPYFLLDPLVECKKSFSRVALTTRQKSLSHDKASPNSKRPLIAASWQVDIGYGTEN